MAELRYLHAHIFYPLKIRQKIVSAVHSTSLCRVGVQWGRETLIGSMVGAVSCLLMVVVALVCCCRRCCTDHKKVKTEAER